MDGEIAQNGHFQNSRIGPFSAPLRAPLSLLTLPRISDKQAKVASPLQTGQLVNTTNKQISDHISLLQLPTSVFTTSCIDLLPSCYSFNSSQTTHKPKRWSTPELSPLQPQLSWQLCLSTPVSTPRAPLSFRLMARTMIV